ncbi:MAG TPA: squalene synthase HpnC [Dehalococcoidia bacterium]|nr:squalene synthase HpnC [Dehalococcoidia bacterium]
MLARSPTYTPPTLDEAYEHCRRIALGRYENFPVVSWLLPRDLRKHLYAIYAYCRGVDDLGDEAEGDRLAVLDDWERELYACYDGAPTEARFVALADTIRGFDIPIEPFLWLIEANRRDQTVTRYESFEDLLEYCSYSANPVGHLVLYVFGYRDPARQRLSDATCSALQLTNFWQDVTLDWEKGRVYIPQEDMARFDVTDDVIRDRRITPNFRRLIAFEVARTREYFAEGAELIGHVRGRLRTDLRLFTLGGLAVLDEIARRGHDVLTARPALSRRRKAVIGLRGVMPLRVRLR